MDKREETRPVIDLTAKGLLAFFAEGYASSNRQEDEPLDDVLIDGESYDLERLASAIAYDISQARSQAYEHAAQICEESDSWTARFELAQAIRQHSQNGGEK